MQFITLPATINNHAICNVPMLLEPQIA